MHELIATHFAPAFDIGELADAAVVESPGDRIALTTDSYVVSPLFFPGGDIGALSVYGTVNDLSVVGARPLYLTAGFIIEEGFPFGDLERIVASMSGAAKRSGVKIVTGDTKVVDRGKGDGIFINTTGVGAVPGGVELSATRIRPGDKIIINGTIGNHGIAVMSERNGLSFDPPVESDAAPLTGLVQTVMEKADGVRVMRDPTRGGLATALKEFAGSSGLCMAVSESLVPLAPGVRGACDLLGLDPLYVANEGVLLAVTSPDVSEYLVDRMRKNPLGAHSAVIGEVEDSPEGAVLLRTEIGGRRMLQMLEGEQLPRIC